MEKDSAPVRVDLYDTICAGGLYTFGGNSDYYFGATSVELYDVVHQPHLCRDSITIMHLEVVGTMANSLVEEYICENSLPYTWDGETVSTPGTHLLDHRTYSARGCLLGGGEMRLTVLARPHTYIYDTVRSTAKGYDYDDTTEVALMRSGYYNGPCSDSVVTTYTHYDYDETIDTLRTPLSHSQCDGTHLFAGVVRTATGVYADTVVVDAFHVAITTLDLTINYSNTGDTAAVACDSFTWYGTDYTASATPQQVFTNAAGCDSTVTLALTINYSTTGDTVAVAFDRFVWYGQAYTATGSHTHVLQNAAGCDSTVTLTLTILEGYAADPTFGDDGIEAEAYGYCAGPGAIRYRLRSGQPDQYRLVFDNAAFAASGWTDISVPGSIDIEVADGLVAGDYTATLTFRHSAYPDLESAPMAVSIHVNLPESYVKPLFSDVIALVDTCHCLTDVQWYHREVGESEWTLIPGATDYVYHQPGGLTGEYFVSVRMNGMATYTCPQADLATLISAPQPTLTAWPNPTTGSLTLSVEGSHQQDHELRIMNTTGLELERRVFEGNSLQLDLSAYQRGSYIVSVDGMVVRVIRN